MRLWIKGGTLNKYKELFPVAGHVMCFVDNHLAHYRGWTICVVRDMNDDDWSAQATLGTYGTLAAYHQADKTEFILAQKWFPTKEEAFDRLVKVLDRHLDKPLREARRAAQAKAQARRRRDDLRKRHKVERQRKKHARNR